MQVTINVEANQMGETVIDLFKTLSDDKKQEVAAGIVKSWLNLDPNAERTLKEQEVLDHLRKDPDLKGYSDERIKDNYQYKSKLSSFKSTRERFIEDVNKETITYIRAEIVKQVQEDPTVKKLIEATAEEVKKNMPAFVHDAMIAFFCTHMEGVTNGITTALMQSKRAEDIAKNVSTQTLGYTPSTGQAY